MKIDKYYKKINSTEFAKYLLIDPRESITEDELKFLKNIEPKLELVNNTSVELVTDTASANIRKFGAFGRLRRHENNWIKIVKLEEDYFVVGIHANATTKAFRCDDLIGLSVCLKNEYKGL